MFIGVTDLDDEELDNRGIATFDIGNTHTADVGFVVMEWAGAGITNLETAQFTTNTAAHEAGHTFGLEHVNRQGFDELMRDGSQATNVVNAQTKFGFLDVALPVFDDPRSTQNSFRTLWTNLGLD